VDEPPRRGTVCGGVLAAASLRWSAYYAADPRA
jgi:hypothetical protein